ncbi:alpha-ribazole phosphatase [soil metagenome]
MEATRIYLVRHGRTSWNDSGQAQGHTDIHLDEVGRLQAQALAARFHGHSLRRVLSSDLARAYETAVPVAHAANAPHETTERLRERSFGEWEGLAYHEVTSRLGPTASVSWFEVRPPGGESFGDVWSRLIPITDELFASEGETMVVSHGGTGSLLLSQLLKGSLETARAFRFSNAGVTILEKRSDGLFRLVAYDDTSHLP